mmetsp:Transcript_6636/g.26699  ORF Transcript_6636/g.26699 Transcript_6636/m.26699 type:complete len:227 (+) Transcript_6636:253-933(+)
MMESGFTRLTFFGCGAGLAAFFTAGLATFFVTDLTGRVTFLVDLVFAFAAAGLVVVAFAAAGVVVLIGAVTGFAAAGLVVAALAGLAVAAALVAAGVFVAAAFVAAGDLVARAAFGAGAVTVGADFLAAAGFFVVGFLVAAPAAAAAFVWAGVFVFFTSAADLSAVPFNRFGSARFGATFWYRVAAACSNSLRCFGVSVALADVRFTLICTSGATLAFVDFTFAAD